MAYRSSLHVLIAWAKRRLDEMDAGLSAMERDTEALGEEARRRAARALEEARAQRAAFAARLAGIEDIAARELDAAQRQLGDSLHRFEIGMARWAELAGRQGETLAQRARHQLDAWNALAAQYRDQAATAAAERKAAILAAVAELEQAAAEQARRLAALESAGAGSWKAMADAVAQTRRAFDDAAADMRRRFEDALRPPPPST